MKAKHKSLADVRMWINYEIESPHDENSKLIRTSRATNKCVALSDDVVDNHFKWYSITMMCRATSQPASQQPRGKIIFSAVCIKSGAINGNNSHRNSFKHKPCEWSQTKHVHMHFTTDKIRTYDFIVDICSHKKFKLITVSPITLPLVSCYIVIF